MTDETNRIDDPEAQDLVAYLDRELDESGARRVEQRLAADPEYRDRLQQLQSTWDMLDYLPRASTDDEFTHTTIDMVTVSATGERLRGSTGTFSNVAFWVAAAAVVLVAMGVGYRVTDRLVSAPDRHLVRDLPIIENVDLYSHVDDIEFLRALDQSGLFADDDIVEDLNGAT